MGHVTIAPTFAEGLLACLIEAGAERRDGPIGIGGEVSWLAIPAQASSSAFLIVAVHGTYHFGQTGGTRTAEPFVQGGVSFVPTGGGGLLLEFGGGADWWLTPRAGIRMAVRERIVTPSAGLLGFEVGLVFR